MPASAGVLLGQMGLKLNPMNSHNDEIHGKDNLTLYSFLLKCKAECQSFVCRFSPLICLKMCKNNTFSKCSYWTCQSRILNLMHWTEIDTEEG